MKERITDWATTLPGLSILAFLAWCVWLEPELLRSPGMLIPLAVGLAGIWMKDKSNG